MPRKPAARHAATRDVALEQFQRGAEVVRAHPIFAPLWQDAVVYRQEQTPCPANGLAVVDNNGCIWVHPTRRGAPEGWVWVLAHCLLHLGFGHLHGERQPDDRAWVAACDCVVTRFLADLKLGRPPAEVTLPRELPGQDEARLRERFLREGVPDELQALGIAGPHAADMRLLPQERIPTWRREIDWPRLFGVGLSLAVSSAVDVAAGRARFLGDPANARSMAERARAWCISAYPLLGALATSFRLVEDPEVCRRLQISVAAVDAEAQEIFVNPAAGLDERESRFVMAHELLHVGLRHHARRQGREPFLWNVSCDYVINQWLLEMGVGTLPAGLLYDPELRGLSAEAVYDRIVTDMRRYRKLATLRGVGLGDMLEPRAPDWWLARHGCDLDDFYRRALGQGLAYHETQGRGLLPAGLVEEIRAQLQPPIPWDVQLAAWFDAHFPPVEPVRSYARPSRRQAATPDIPRPRWVRDPRWLEGRTFGVVLDTSGSMERELLARALGAIAGYSLAHDVPAARVVFCDAAAYDAGYLPPEAIAGRVQVRGRGGTVLQPGVDLLDRAADFPQDGPLLIITDTLCDHVRVPGGREHAFLIPDGRRLPFVPRGSVFRVAQ